MSDLHELLWTLCRKLPSDFEPFGARNRDIADPCGDCSCGCIHFVPLAGELGNDWGVCANPQSPRAGLLTFEHQGCPQFETEVEAMVNSDATLPPATPSSAKKLKINFDDLQMAIEGSGEQGIQYYLDRETGEIIALHEDFPDYEELNERIDQGLSERYLSIDAMLPRESFRIMEDFAAATRNLRLRDRLEQALSRSKPFRHFKDVVHSDPKLREAWFAFRDDALATHASDWLKMHHVDAELVRQP